MRNNNMFYLAFVLVINTLLSLHALAQSLMLSSPSAGNSQTIVLQTSTCVSPPSGIVSWWPGDNNSNDLSGNNNSGVLNGGAMYAPGKVGATFSLSSLSNSYVEVSSSAPMNFGTGDFSIDAWINTTDSLGVHAILDKRSQLVTGGRIGYGFGVFDGRLGLQLADGTGSPTQTNYISDPSDPNVADGSWHFVAVTVDRDGMIRFYVDGSPRTTGNPTDRTGSLTNSNPLRIGRSLFGADALFNGLIDEVELFNRVLSQQEISDIFNAGGFGKCKPTGLGYICGYKFNDIDGDGVLDATESKIANWIISYSGPVSGSVSTDSSGNYCISSLPAGAYYVCEYPQSGWIATTAVCESVTVGAGQTLTVNFGNRMSSTGWTQLTTGTNQQINSITCINEDTCIAVGNNRTVLWTGNGGLTWEPITIEDSGSSFKHQKTSVMVENHNSSRSNKCGGCLTFVGGDGKFFRTQVRSMKTGWQRFSTLSTDRWNGVGIKEEGVKLQKTASQSNVVAYVAGNGGRILKTSDDGNNWDSQNTGITQDLNDIDMWDENGDTVLAVGVAGTIIRTFDGGATWQVLAGGNFSKFLLTKAGPVALVENHNSSRSNKTYPLSGPGGPNCGWIVAGTNGTLLASSDCGNTFTVVPIGTIRNIRKIHYFNGRYLLTTDEIGTTPKTLGNLGTTKGQASASPPATSIIYVVGDSGTVLSSTDGGDNWTLDQIDPSVNLLGIDAVGDKILIVGTGGAAYVKENAPEIRSVPYNQRWNLVSVPMTLSDYQKTTVFPDAVSDAYAYTGAYAMQETLKNGVGYWLKFPYNLEISFIGATIDIDTIEVTEGWNIIGAISSSVAVASIVSDPPGMSTSQFFGYDKNYTPSDAIEPGKGFWVKVNQDGKLILSSSTSVTTSNKVKIVPTGELPPPPPDEKISSLVSEIPKQFALEQNYPNPFNPITVFRYSLPVESKVTLRIYNVLGQVVSTLVDELQNAGYKSVEWNSANNLGNLVSSGVYFYRMEAISGADPTKSFMQVRKLLIIR